MSEGSGMEQMCGRCGYTTLVWQARDSRLECPHCEVETEYEEVRSVGKEEPVEWVPVSEDRPLLKEPEEALKELAMRRNYETVENLLRAHGVDPDFFDDDLTGLWDRTQERQSQIYYYDERPSPLSSKE